MSDPGTNVSEGLVLVHLRKIREAEKKKDEAVNALRTARKAAKQDGVDLQTLDYVRGIDKLNEHEQVHGFNQIVTYSKFLGVGPYSQLDMFEPPQADETNLIDIASAKGLKAGKLGQDQGSNPYDAASPAGQAWLNSWHDGQRIILEAGITAPPKDEEAPKTSGRRRKGEETAH